MKYRRTPADQLWGDGGMPAQRRLLRTPGGLLQQCRQEIQSSLPWLSLQVLTRGDDPFDASQLFFRLAHEGLDVHDPLPLLARDLRPVVGVGGVWQVLVLLELLAAVGAEGADHAALRAPGKVA